MNQDEEHLRLLSIFHYVVAGMMALFALFPIFHLIIGLAMLFAPAKFSGHGDPAPAFIGLIFVVFAGVFIMCGWIFAGFVFAAGRFLARRKHHTFCLVMAGVECLFMPFGTALGVFSIIVLTREPVKKLFAVQTETSAA
jgi:predicted membrane channel-forming protein YqfA (hemolysin III family)